METPFNRNEIHLGLAIEMEFVQSIINQLSNLKLWGTHTIEDEESIAKLGSIHLQLESLKSHQKALIDDIEERQVREDKE